MRDPDENVRWLNLMEARALTAESALEAAEADLAAARTERDEERKIARDMFHDAQSESRRAEAAESALEAATETLRQIAAIDNRLTQHSAPTLARAFLARTDSGKTGFESLPLLPEDL